MKLALAVAAVLMVACASDEPTMGDYAEAYAEAVVAHAEGCGPLTGNREKTVEYIVETTCRLVDCAAPASGDIDACLDAIAAKSCDDALAPSACVAMWY
jgi:hypothetical protein